MRRAWRIEPLDLHHVVQIHATQDKHLEKDGLHPYFLCDEFKVEAHFVTSVKVAKD